MATLGTFDSFTTARLGIYAAQHGLRVTGNNISNINTAGYTRQRVDQVSFKTGGNDRYASFMDRHIGSGALVRSINQIRDPYLDIRYRNTSSSTAYYDTKLSGLQEIAAILDEVGKGGKDGDDATKGDGLLYAQLQELADQLRAYGASPTSDNNTLIRSAAETLTALFQNYAGRLEQVRKDTEKDLVKNVEGANEILKNIRDLNKSIRDAELHGDKALELRDERNRQIDALSEYMHIKVEYTMEDVGAGIQVEKLTISLANDNPDPKVETDSSVLVDGLYATQLSIPENKPYLNPHILGDINGANADLDKLKGFLFLKEVDRANPGNIDPNDIVDIDWTDANGNPTTISVVGTNDPADEGVLMRENDNYTIQLGKLLDVRGEEWINTKSTWTEAQGGTAAQKAVYDIQITASTGWTDGQIFSVAGKDYTIGTDITLNDMTDPTKLAQFLAPKLSAANTEYVVTADGDKLHFVARNAGAFGSPNAPTKAPSVDFNPNGGGSTVTFGPPAQITAGVDSVKPPIPPNPPEGTEIDPVTGTEVTTAYVEVEGKWFQVTMEKEHTREVVLDDNDLYGALQAQRETLTEEGEFSSADDQAIDENALTKRGIPYYQKSFDLLARQLAQHFNELNQGYMLNHKGNYVDKDGKEITLEGVDENGVLVPAAPVSKYNGLTEAQARNLIGNGFILKDDAGNPILDKDGKQQADLNAWLEQNGGVKMGGPLFSNSNAGNDTDGITASNIDISKGWSSGEWMVVPKFEVLFPDDKPADGEEGEGGLNHTTQDININHMITLIDKGLVYDPKDMDPDAIGKNLFTGSFNDMFSNMMGVQAKDAKATNIALNNDYTTLVALDSSREGVSGVDLNDEAMNMMQFQKAYSAACRLMTTIDEALDRLINNTGIAGR